MLKIIKIKLLDHQKIEDEIRNLYKQKIFPHLPVSTVNIINRSER